MPVVHLNKVRVPIYVNAEFSKTAFVYQKLTEQTSVWSICLSDSEQLNM